MKAIIDIQNRQIEIINSLGSVVDRYQIDSFHIIPHQFAEPEMEAVTKTISKTQTRRMLRAGYFVH